MSVRSRSGWIVASMGVLGSAIALAESPPVTEPIVFVWTNGLPCDDTPSLYSFLVPVVRPYLGPIGSGQSTHLPSGAEAAEQVSTYIREHIQTSAWTQDACYGTGTHPAMLTASSLCISFQGFGQDNYVCDDTDSLCTPASSASSPRATASPTSSAAGPRPRPTRPPRTGEAREYSAGFLAQGRIVCMFYGGA